MEDQKIKSLKALKRLLPTLSEEEANRVQYAYDHNQPTGYATVDLPWNKFYEDIPKSDFLLHTTPYQGLVMSNKDYPNEIAIEYFGVKITFGELFKKIDEAAKSFEEYGIKKGDFVTICSTTTPEVIFAFYALSKLGAAANIIAPFYETKDLIARINDCDSKLILFEDKFYRKFKSALNEDKQKNVVILPLMSTSILRFVQPTYFPNGKYNETSWNRFISDGRGREEAAVCGYEYRRPLLMNYSSGTTGPSKAILLSVDSFQTLANAYGNSGFDTTRGQALFQNIPPWHSTGSSLGFNFPLQYGVKVCTDPRFDRRIFIKNVLKYRPEFILTNTSMYQGFVAPECQKLLKGKSLDFLKYPVEGGEPLTDRDMMGIEGKFIELGAPTGIHLYNGYGQCEKGATITTDITGHKFARNASGIPLPDITTIGIFDSEFNEVPYNTRGRILVDTEVGMIGYFKNPEATDAHYHTDSSGVKWGITGDLGYINPDGSLVVEGREDDFSVINGEQIFNFDIERAILTSNVVRLCEVQTYPDDNNRLVAHIVWEDEIAQILKKNPNRINEYLSHIQQTVLETLGSNNAVPNSFCIRTGFPSAYSGKRDVKRIKNDISGIIDIQPIKRMVLQPINQNI